jgi:integrase
MFILHHHWRAVAMNTRRDQSPSFGSFITGQYLPNVKCFKRSWRTDESLLRIHVLPLFATRLIGQIDLTGIISVVCRMQEAGYSSGSINRVLAVLRRAFNLALKWQVCGVSGNPVSGLSVGPDILRSRFLSLEEAHRLIAALEADENRVAANAILLLLLTGARRNEITYAKWDYVNWGGKTLFVPVSKTGRPRMIALSRSAISLLQALQRSPGNAYIFPSPITGRPSPSLHFPWRRIKRRAGLPGLRLHDLRHSFASFLVNGEVSLYVVQQLLGHVNFRTTQRYAHLMPEALAKAVASLDAHLLGEGRARGRERPAECPLPPRLQPQVEPALALA